MSWREDSEVEPVRDQQKYCYVRERNISKLVTGKLKQSEAKGEQYRNSGNMPTHLC